jgi:hypothetical protein
VEEQEALVAVHDQEAVGIRSEVEGEARRGGVQGSEYGGGIDIPAKRLGRRQTGGGGVEEVAKERSRAREAACGHAAPAMAGERSPEKVGDREADKDVAKVVVGEGITHCRRLWFYRQCRRNRGGERWGFGLGFLFGFASANFFFIALF